MLPPTYVEGFHDLEAVKAMEYRPLGKTGLIVSKLAIGGATFSHLFGTYDEKEAIEIIRQGIKRGINYIDTAPYYGQGRSETVIGKALKGIPREAYYIATKVGRYELDYKRMFDFSKEKTRESFHKSLKLLGLDYVDLIQCHDIDYAPSLDIIVTETLPELANQVADGKARFIGITGYPLSVLKECIEKSKVTISCVLSYARYTLIDDTLMEYVPYFKEKNIGIINGAALGQGLLTNADPPAWHAGSAKTLQICAYVRKVCKENNIELAKLAIWYSMQSEDISTHPIGMHSMSHLNMGFDIVQNGITEKEKALLKEIQEKYLSKITDKHWENKELQIYWDNMKKLK